MDLGATESCGITSDWLVRNSIKCSTCSRGKLDTHAMTGVHDTHYALGVNFPSGCPQAEINFGLTREWGFGLHVASAQAQVGQSALRERLRFRRYFWRIGAQPGAEGFPIGFGEIHELKPGLPVGVGPHYLGLRAQLSQIGQRKLNLYIL